MSRYVVLKLLAQAGLWVSVAFFAALFAVCTGLLVGALRKMKGEDGEGYLNLVLLYLGFEAALGCVLLGVPFAVVYRRWLTAGDIGVMSVELITLLLLFGLGILHALLKTRILQGGKGEKQESSNG